MCAIDDCDDSFSVYRTARPKAKRQHKCDECGREIQKGETYLYAFGVYEGRGDSYHICAHCSVAADWLTANCGGYLHYGVRDDIQEHVGEYPAIMGLRRFKIGMARKWKRFASDALMPIPSPAKPISVAELV